jgi:hypothetical protein
MERTRLLILTPSYNSLSLTQNTNNWSLKLKVNPPLHAPTNKTGLKHHFGSRIYSDRLLALLPEFQPKVDPLCHAHLQQMSCLLSFSLREGSIFLIAAYFAAALSMHPFSIRFCFASSNRELLLAAKPSLLQSYL